MPSGVTISGTITSASQLISTAQNSTNAGKTYYVQGTLSTVGLSGANPSSKITFLGHPDGSAQISSMWLQNASRLTFQGIRFLGSVELRMHSTITPSPHHIEFINNLWQGVDNNRFCLGASNTFSGRAIEDILIQGNTFKNIPVAQTAGQSWAAWNTGSGDPQFDSGYALFPIGGNGTLRRWNIYNNLFSHVINDGIQVASAEDFQIIGNKFEFVAWYSRTVGNRHADPVHSQYCNGLVLQDNVFWMNDQPIQVQDSNTNWTIVNNLITASHNSGFGFGHFWGNSTQDTGVTNFLMHDNTIYNCGLDGFPDGLWRGGGGNNQFYDNICPDIGAGGSAWDKPLSVSPTGQFVALTGGNFTTAGMSGASPANFTSPSPSFPAMTFAVGTTSYLTEANWIPVGSAFNGKGYRPV